MAAAAAKGKRTSDALWCRRAASQQQKRTDTTGDRTDVIGDVVGVVEREAALRALCAGWLQETHAARSHGKGGDCE